MGEFDKELQLEKFKIAVLEYAKNKGYDNAEFVITFEYTTIYGNVYPSCSFLTSSREKRTLVQANDTDYYLVKNDEKVAPLKTKNITQALDYAFEATFTKLYHPKESEPTIHFDKKVLESGLSFKEAYMRMVEGKKISRPCFMGWWFMNHESKVIIHDRYANELKEGDITNTVTNTLANDWEVIE